MFAAKQQTANDPPPGSNKEEASQGGESKSSGSAGETDGGASFSEKTAPKAPAKLRSKVVRWILPVTMGVAIAGVAFFGSPWEGGVPTLEFDLRGVVLKLDAMIHGGAPLVPELKLDAQGRRPRTLVLSLDDAVLKLNWRRSVGWSAIWRNHTTEFVQRAQRAGYEVIIWTKRPSFEVESELDEIRNTGAITHLLSGDNTNFVVMNDESKLVRDLTRLDRDPTKLIVVDINSDSFGLFPNTNRKSEADDPYKHNVLKIRPFQSRRSDDLELSKVARVLEDLSRFNIPDTSIVVDRFNADPDGDIFAEEREIAALALRGVKGDKKQLAARQTTKATTPTTTTTTTKKQQDEDDDDEGEEEQKSNGWGGYLRSWIPGGSSKATETSKPVSGMAKGGLPSN